MGNRRTAIPSPVMSEGAVDFRLTNTTVPQWVQTGAQNSTNDGNFGNIRVTGTATIVNSTITNLAVTSSFTVQSSALKSMAFQSSTALSASVGSITNFTSTGTLTLGVFTASSGLVTGYFNALTSTGGSVKLAVMST